MLYILIFNKDIRDKIKIYIIFNSLSSKYKKIFPIYKLNTRQSHAQYSQKSEAPPIRPHCGGSTTLTGDWNALFCFEVNASKLNFNNEI